MTQEEKIKDLEQRIELMSASDKELYEELMHWKKVAAGQKGKMKQMASQLQSFRFIINDKDIIIKGLESKVGEISTALKEKESMIEELYGDVAVAEANLEYYKSLPWWKRMFI